MLVRAVLRREKTATSRLFQYLAGGRLPENRIKDTVVTRGRPAFKHVSQKDSVCTSEVSSPISLVQEDFVRSVLLASGRTTKDVCRS